MANDKAKKTREERLAAKLRENLRRRKAQGRALDANSGARSGGGGASLETALPKAGASS